MAEITEVKAQGRAYRIGVLNVFEQWDVARKLLPVIAGAADILTMCFKAFGPMLSPSQNEEDSIKRWALAKAEIDKLMSSSPSKIIEPLSQALSLMSDVDSRFVINMCLSKVTVVVPEAPTAVVALMPQPGVLAYQDIDLPTMLLLVYKTLEVNIIPFLFAPRVALK